MALRLTVDINDKKYFSCDFPKLVISSTSSYANFELEVNGITALSTRYYMVSGRATVYSLASCIQLEMEKQYSAYSTVVIKLSAGSETQEYSCKVLMCKVRCMALSVDEFLANSFLTTSAYHLTTMHNSEVLPFYIEGSSNYAIVRLDITATVRLSDGSVRQHQYSNSRRLGYGIAEATVSAKDIQAYCTSALGQCQLLSFSIAYQSRFIHFYVVPCASAQEFRFKNNFGCSEAVGLPATTISKLESEFSEAMVDGKLQHYDTHHTRTYEVQTSQLLSGYMTWLEQFLTSSSIMRRLPNGMFADVLISDYTFEQTDAPGEENTLSFTWQFTDGQETPHRYALPEGIFTNPFNETFV